MVEMMRRKVSDQVKEHNEEKLEPLDIEIDMQGPLVSTGSTLLDLAISGTVRRGGGIPGGILVEIFGPEGSGKTVMACEIAGSIVRQGGQIRFNDTEARLQKNFAQLFGLKVRDEDYFQPNTVTETFEASRDWEPEPKGKIHGVITDGLAALLSEMEAEGEDKMGMRRALEFSVQLRKTCRIIPKQNILMICTNQVRENIDAGQYAPKYKTTGGKALPFYASLRLHCRNPAKIKKTLKIHGKELDRVVGVETTVEVFKSSIAAPYKTAPMRIIFDYGIDDIGQNLQYIKTMKSNDKFYRVGGEKVGMGLSEAIKVVEEDNLEKQLREEVIDLWIDIEGRFKEERKPKSRD